MWTLVVRSPSNAPIEYEVKPGKNTLGRKPDNNIIIADEVCFAPARRDLLSE